MSLAKKYKERLKEISRTPKKSLGQNFLINPGAIRKIIEHTEASAEHHIVEIGPGLGAITDELIKKGRDLTLIEIDKDFAGYWRKQGQNVIQKDALKVNWQNIVSDKPSILVANLPYQIASSLVVELATLQDTFSEMVLMFQKEVAQRITAKPQTKDYGMLSVVAQLRWSCKRVVDLSPRSFYPAPKVSSRALFFKKKEFDLDAKKFLPFVKRCFSHRRKLLAYSLLGYKNLSSKPAIHEVFRKLGLESTCRAEELSLHEFTLLFKEVIK